MEERHREDRGSLVYLRWQSVSVSRVIVQGRRQNMNGERADPDLALALAFSISAASGVGGEGAEQRKEGQAEVQKMWLFNLRCPSRGEGKGWWG